MDGGELFDSNLLRPVPPGPAGQEGHYAGHGSPDPGLGSNAVHASVVGTNESSTLSRYPWDMMAGLAKAIAVSLAAPGHIRIPSQFPGNPKQPPKGGVGPPEGHSPRKKRGPSQGGGPSSSHQASKPGGKNAPKPRLHGQFQAEADTVSPRGTMNPDFPSPMPPMAGDAEQLGKEGQGDQVLDRPECLPAFRVPHLTDRVAIVQLGFRSRPLRDGGGKPSPKKDSTPFSDNFPIGYFGRPDHDPYPALD